MMFEFLIILFIIHTQTKIYIENCAERFLLNQYFSMLF